MQKQLIYLASPYSDKDEAVMEWRYEQTLRFVAAFIKNGHMVFSPIVYTHEMAKKYKLERQHQFWANQNERWLDYATALWILELPGWRESAGIRHEIRYMSEVRKMPYAVKYILPTADVSITRQIQKPTDSILIN